MRSNRLVFSSRIESLSGSDTRTRQQLREVFRDSNNIRSDYDLFIASNNLETSFYQLQGAETAMIAAQGQAQSFFIINARSATEQLRERFNTEAREIPLIINRRKSLLLFYRSELPEAHHRIRTEEHRRIAEQLSGLSDPTPLSPYERMALDSEEIRQAEGFRPFRVNSNGLRSFRGVTAWKDSDYIVWRVI